MLWHSDSQLFDMDEVLVLGDGLAVLKETGDMLLHRLTDVVFRLFDRLAVAEAAG